MYRPLLALLGIALVLAISARVVLRRREAAEQAPATPTPASVALPVATPAGSRAPIPVPVAIGADGSQASAAEAPASSGSDDSPPVALTIKAKRSSRLYHTPSSPAWSRMHADAWFETEEAAEAAGFKRWDWRRDRS